MAELVIRKIVCDLHGLEDPRDAEWQPPIGIDGKIKKIALCVDCRENITLDNYIEAVRLAGVDVYDGTTGKKKNGDIYPCGECGREFTTKQGLARHTTAIHVKEDEGEIVAYKCPDCDRSFPSTNGLNAHSRSHSRERQNA